MKTKSKRQTRHPPTLTAHISFGEVGLGPDRERFIRVNIDIAKQRHMVLLRYDDFVDGSRQALAHLNALGAHLISSPAKSEFLRRLQDLGPQQPSFNVATRVGPFGKAFVLPRQVLSATEEDVETWFDDGLANYLSWARKGGTLKKWKRLAALAEGNSRLILALGVAFVGPLRLIAPVESIVFQLTGFGGTGKTSIGVVASSIWGQRCLGGKPHPLGSGDAWNNTVSNLERVLATRDHTFLFLDEAHLARPNWIGRIASSPQNQLSRNVSDTQPSPLTFWRSRVRAPSEREISKQSPVNSHCCVNSTPTSKPSSRALTTRCQSNK